MALGPAEPVRALRVAAALRPAPAYRPALREPPGLRARPALSTDVLELVDRAALARRALQATLDGSSAAALRSDVRAPIDRLD